MHTHRIVRSRWLAVWVAAFLVCTQARAADDERIGTEAGIGIASAVVSLIYGPAKVVYATGGAAIAGLAWLFSAGDREVVSPILTAALRGDYVVTPAHLRRDRPIEFIGRDPSDRRLRHAANY